MSSQLIGALFAAIVLQNTDAFTFYCIMTSICFFASLFFLFLQPVEAKDKDNLKVETPEDNEPQLTAKEDIKETFKMLSDRRIRALYPLMFSTALNLGILSSVFIKMMVQTMKDSKPEWSDSDQTSNALLCMLGLGSGEIIGSLVFGRITDACKTNTTILVNLGAATVGYGCLILYGAIYEFSFPLAILMTFTWGVQDAGVNCLISSLLGFQFLSKTTPFSVYKFLQSLLIFLCTCVESFTDNRTSWLSYFAACYVIAMLAWFILYRYFEFYTEAELE